MHLTIKTLMMVSILLLATVCVVYAQPRDKTEPGFNPASLERAGPATATQNVFAIESFDVAYDLGSRVVATERTRNELTSIDSPFNRTSATREAYARRSYKRAAGFVLRE